MKTYIRTIARLMLSVLLLLLLADGCCAADSQQCGEGSSLPVGFVYADELIPGLIFEPRYYTANNFTARNVDGYFAPVCIMTFDCALALRGVQLELNSQGLALKVFDAYRPQRAVDRFVQWAKDLGDQVNKAQYYPEVDKRDLFRDGYIASPSSHSRGSAVDLTVVRCMKGGQYRELDMGTGFDYFGKKAWPDDKTVTAAQHDNRMVLRDVMLKHGFVPYEWEWWHFRLATEPFPDTYFNFPVQ